MLSSGYPSVRLSVPQRPSHRLLGVQGARVHPPLLQRLLSRLDHGGKCPQGRLDASQNDVRLIGVVIVDVFLRYS